MKSLAAIPFIAITYLLVEPPINDSNVQESVQPTAPGSRIAFVSRRDGNSELYVIDSTAGDPRRLTQTAFDESSPVWSPDGSTIVFVSDQVGRLQLYSMHSDGTNVERLTDTPYPTSMPAWSSDGMQLMYVVQIEGKSRIFVMDADGRNSRELMIDGAWPSRSPDGEQIAFMRGQIPQLWIANLDGTGERLLLDHAKDEQNRLMPDMLPYWSPDGKRILFSGTRVTVTDEQIAKTNTDIYVLELEDNRVHRITHDPSNDYGCGWSSDGKQILAYSDRHGSFDLLILSLEGEEFRRVTDDPAEDFQGTWVHHQK